jgi:hypothetical protein
MDEESLYKNYIHFIDMGAEIVDSEKGMMKFRLYPSKLFMEYLPYMTSDSFSVMLAMIAQVAIDSKPDKDQVKFVKDVLKKLKKHLDETVVYEKHNEENY